MWLPGPTITCPDAQVEIWAVVGDYGQGSS